MDGIKQYGPLNAEKGMILKSLKYSVALCVVLSSVSACAYSSTARSTLIGLSDFREIGPKLYVSPNIDPRQNQQIITLISDARSRITKQFGAPTSKPTIIIAEGKKEQQQFKLYGASGKLLIAPWGNYMILSNSLRSIDVAAHELVHAEIAERLGYLTRMRKIPTWLDEGIALQVDHRPRYTNLSNIDQIEFERVVSLSTPKLFWSQESEQNIKNYQGAKMAVQQSVIPVIDRKGLYRILEEIKAGESIESFIEREN